MNKVVLILFSIAIALISFVESLLTASAHTEIVEGQLVSVVGFNGVSIYFFIVSVIAFIYLGIKLKKD